MKQFATFLLLVSATGFSLAQSVTTLMGAKANGIGYASATSFDEWSLFNNVAGLAKTEHTTAAFTYDMHPTMAGANRTAAVIAVPFKLGVAGAGVYRFGDNLYNEQILTAAFSNQFGIAALGARVNYIQDQTEGFGSKSVVTIGLGGIATLTPQLAIGAYITNINQPTIGENEHLPTKMNAAIRFTPTDKIFLITEIEKDLDYDATWKMGFQYQFNEKFFARTGYNLHPNAAFFGLGFKTKKLSVDYAVQHHALLNFSHQASVSYTFKK
jgi:hypothetical protein